MTNYAAIANQLNGLPETATVEEYKKIQKEFDKAADKLGDSAKNLKKAEMKEFSKSKVDFANAINSISDQDTLKAANGQIKQATANLIKDFLEVNKTTCHYSGK